METFLLFSENDFAAVTDNNDSGTGSCPTTPGSIDDEVTTEECEFKQSLDWRFCGSLNAGLFDGDFPAELYTHINVKTEENDESWCSEDSFSQTKLETPLSLLEERFTSSDTYDGQLPFPDLISEFLNLEKNVHLDEKKLGLQPSESDAKESVNLVKALATRKDLPVHENEHSLFKRELRSCKRDRKEKDHSYCKLCVYDQKAEDTEGKDEMDSTEEGKVGLVSSPTTTRKTKDDDYKDGKYWERRTRNNLAAKRSREAKRAREILIAKRSVALEKENANLKKQVRKLKADVKRVEKILRSMI